MEFFVMDVEKQVILLHSLTNFGGKLPHPKNKVVSLFGRTHLARAVCFDDEAIVKDFKLLTPFLASISL